MAGAFVLLGYVASNSNKEGTPGGEADDAPKVSYYRIVGTSLYTPAYMEQLAEAKKTVDELSAKAIDNARVQVTAALYSIKELAVGQTIEMNGVPVKLMKVEKEALT